MAATAKALDMTDVKEGGNFNKKRIPSGDYLAKVLKVEDAQVKKGDNQGADQWLFTIQIVKFPSAKYPYYCTLVPNQLWKVRNLAVACGMTVPKKRLKLDPNKLAGKFIGVSIEDTEYDGRDQSEITGVFPAAELEDFDATGARDETDEDSDDEGDEEEPAPRRTKKPAPAPEPEEDEEEDEEETEASDEFDAMDRNELKTYLKTADDSFVAKKSQSDDDLRALARAVVIGGDDEDEDEDDEEEAPPPPPRRAAKKATRKPAVTDDELDELDLDDL